MENAVQNPFGNQVATVESRSSALVEVESQRAIAEVQAAMIIARKFPRNQIEVMDRILSACTRPGLAETAMYAYSRGGSDITGPSIRLAEVLAQEWGNIQFGIRELDQANGESTVEAYAWDIERNVRQVKSFKAKHIRATKKGTYKLEDPRDIYEMVANQGARRLRACILGIIPGDVVEAAQKQCEITLTTKIVITPELLTRMLERFAEYGVTKEQIEKRIQRRIDAITPALMVQLGKISNSLKDGMSSPSDWFESSASAESPTTSKTESVKDKLRKDSGHDEKSTTVTLVPTEPAEAPKEAVVSTLNPSVIQGIKMLWNETLKKFPADKHNEMGHALKEKFDFATWEEIGTQDKYEAILSEIEAIRKGAPK